jgi:hypothetical protein
MTDDFDSDALDEEIKAERRRPLHPVGTRFPVKDDITSEQLQRRRDADRAIRRGLKREHARNKRGDN